MTVLSDRDIRERIADDDLSIAPFDPDTQLGDSSIDLRLAGELTEYDSGREYAFTDGVEIRPGRNYLATTMEYIDLPDDVVGDIKGRSSIGRHFIQVHCAGWVDAGYHGQITLEITSFRDSPITFPVGQRICQMVLHETKTTPETPYPEKEGQKYTGQRGATASRLHMEADEYE